MHPRPAVGAGYEPTLNPPDKQADVAKEIGIIRSKGRVPFIRDARLRSMKEILDLNDLYYRLKWAAVDLRLKGHPSPKANEEIIVERHRALNLGNRALDPRARA